MNRLQTVLAALLMVFWMPAASLCLLENAGWIANENGCAHASDTTPASESSEPSSCCTLASALYKTDDNRLATTTSPVEIAAVLIGLAELNSPPTEFVRIESDASGTGLAKNWQFSSRAAATPRAPSLAS